MNKNLQRHKLLEILSLQYINSDIDPDLNIHVSCKEIYSKLKISEFDLYMIIKELTSNEEIDYYFWNDEDKKGLYAKPNGVTAFTNNKYVRLRNKQLKENIKDIVQIFIPVISLIIAFIALTIKFNNNKVENDQQFQLIKNDIKDLKKQSFEKRKDTNIIEEKLHVHSLR